MIEELFTNFNEVAWVMSNIILAGVCFSSILFVIAYTILFNPRATTAGLLVRRAVLSIAGMAFLFVLGIFVDGRAEWYEYPEGIAPWRPVLRLAIYLFVAYSFTSLVVLLFQRKFAPHVLHTAPDEWTVKPRRLKPRK